MCCRGSGYITASMAFVAFPLYANNLRELVEGYWGGRKGLKKKKNPGLQTTQVVLTLLPESLLAGSGAALEGGKKQIHNPVLRF